MSADHNNRNRLLGVFLIPIVVIGVLIVLAMFVLSYQQKAPRAQSRDRTRQLSADTLHKLRDTYDQYGQVDGDADTPVTIREFGDYQCPACGQFAPTARKIRKNLVASGKARFVFFDFPLPMHRNAFQAAIAARCAGRQDTFWPYHDRLYETQRQWAESHDPVSHFLDIAVETGVKTKPLRACIKGSDTKPVINHEKKAGKAIGLRATPTIIVGRTMISGSASYKRIKTLVGNGGGDRQ